MPTNTKLNYIICDAAPANWGKTTTLIEVAQLFRSSPSYYTVLEYQKKPNNNDEWLVIKVNTTGKIILVQTEGDLATSYSDTINYLSIGHHVDIIICACRTSGASYQVVHNIAKKFNYKQIMFSNFCPLDRSLFSTPIISQVNKVHLASLIYNFALAL